MADDVDTTISKLSEVQKAWLLEAFYSRHGWRILGFRSKACALGLCHPCSSRITPHGMAVRARLQEITRLSIGGDQ